MIGSLRGGRTVFITIALPGDVTIAGDVHVPRLVWVTSMDGTIATRAVATFVRAVCTNTIRASFRSARTSWAARHTSSLAGRTDDARRALQLVWKVSDTFRAEVEALTRQTITDAQVDQVLTGLWPDDPTATARTRDAASRRRSRGPPACTAPTRGSPAGTAPPTASSRPCPRGSCGTHPAAATAASRSSAPCSPAPAPAPTAPPSASPPSPDRPPGRPARLGRPAAPARAACRCRRRRGTCGGASVARQAPRASGPRPAG